MAKNRPYVGRRDVIRPDWIGLALPTLRCDCGSALVVAAAPGAEPERAMDLFAVDVGAPMRAWCWDCWPNKPELAILGPLRSVSMSSPGKRTVAKGAEYYQYLKSDAWKQVRIRYLKSKLPKNCYGCQAPWENSFVFHHKTYKNLGCERLMDIAPVCRSCHEAIHAKHEGTKGMGLWEATKQTRKAMIKENKHGRST